MDASVLQGQQGQKNPSAGILSAVSGVGLLSLIAGGLAIVVVFDTLIVQAAKVGVGLTAPLGLPR